MWTHPLPPGAILCNARLLPCARQALANFDKYTCSCVHTCDVDTDSVEISSYKLFPHSACIDSFYHDLDFTKISIMRVFVANRNIKTKSRQTYYTFHDLFSQLGGIFNVFFGCSLLSILEIIQLIKYACKFRKRSNKIWNNNKQEKKKESIVKQKETRGKKKERTVRFA
nr:amiloride-sensitive sodium channel subunit alpha-like [Plodia interpunctella]